MTGKRNFAAIARRYASDVVSGKVPACKWVRLACQRHLDDLEWQKDEGFRYRFDAKAAARVCRFIELMPHTKGKWAAQKQMIVLEPWQVFLTCVGFGWIRKHDGTRRYRRIVLVVPRKNGKSAWAAAVGLYMLLADGEDGAEVYSGATGMYQAGYVFRPAQIMARRRPDMLSHYGAEVNASNIHVLATESKFEPLVGKPGDGASPNCAIIDEYHEHETDVLLDTMETGMGARDQPLTLVITTAGDNISGPCYAMQDRAQKALEGTVADDETFAMIYGVDEGDDWTDPAILRKANPNFGVSVSEDFLLHRQREALSSPRKAGVFRTKHLNIWVQSRAAYFDVQRYMKAADPDLDLSAFAGQEAIIGVDLADKRDLTAVELLFRYKEGFARFGRYYAPEETVELPHNEHLRAWRDAGQLIQTDGAVTDQREILADIMEDLATFEVSEVVFDPWHSRQIAVELIDQGVTCFEFRGSPSNMNEPMRGLDALIASGDLHHGGDLPFTWMLSNVVDGSKTSDLHRPAKERPENKIDGPVACMMALGRWLMHEAPAKSFWEAVA